MAIQASYYPKYANNSIVSVSGTVITDATAFVNQAGTTSVASNNVTGVAATAGFSPIDIVRVTGTVQRILASISSIVTNTSITLTSGFYVTTAEAVTVTQMPEMPLYFDLPFRASSIEFHDETNGFSYFWIEGMPIGNVHKQVWATGVKTLVTSTGLAVFPSKICLSSDIAPISSSFRFVVK